MTTADQTVLVGDFDPRALTGMVQRARRLPTLAGPFNRSEQVETVEDLRRLPTMDSQTLQACIRDLLSPASGEHRSMYLFSSGGTTAAPKLSLIPAHMCVSHITRDWAPLDANDRVVNLFDAGRDWSAHPFMNEVAARAGSGIIAFGRVEQDEIGVCLRRWAGHGANAAAGTPTVLTSILTECSVTGTPWPFKKIIWTGEGWLRPRHDLLQAVAPGVKSYSVYGSTETWVMGANGPRCAIDTYHPVPGQLLEINPDGTTLVTSTSNQASIVLRYQLGDRLGPATCHCGRPSAFRILGRTDNKIKIFGSVFNPDDLVATATGCPGVTGAQIATGLDPSGAETMAIRITASTPIGDHLTGLVRTRLLDTYIELDTLARQGGATIDVAIVPGLTLNPRTGKTPTVVKATPS